MTHRGMKSLIVKVYWQLGCRWLEKERAGSFPGSGQSCPVGVGRPRPASRLLGSAWGVRGTLSLDRPRVASAPTWLPLGCWWATSKGTSLVESRLPATWPAAWNWVECQDCRWGRWMHFGVSHWMSGGPVCPRWPPSAPEELLATSPQEPGGCDWCLGTCPKPGPGGTVFSAPHSSQLGRGAPVPLLHHVACSGRAEGLSRFVCRKPPQHGSPPPHPWAVPATPAANSQAGPEPCGGRRPTWL